MQLQFKRISTKVLLPTLSAISVVFVLFTFYLINSQREKQTAALEGKADRTIDLIADSVAEPIWNMDKVSITQISEAFLKDEEVAILRVKDDDGAVVIELDNSGDNATTRLIWRNSTLKREKFLLGHLDVAFSTHVIDENIRFIRNQLLVLSLGVLLIIFLIVITVSNWVLKPLKQLEKGVRLLTEGQVGYTVTVNSHDELGRLGAAFNNMSGTIHEYQEGLESKIRERTQELEESNGKLSQAMESLWGEMELAKKIQTVLLPHNPHIEGFDIAASLTPADEVGGDYYDIITVDGYNWLVVGDVSGHGVTAGLIMMMVQTAIQTVLHDNPAVTPASLMQIINRSVTKNIQLMGDNKYMTLMIAACMDEKLFKFAGLHEDILIYRAVSGQVEIIETSGMWIGIMPDISGVTDTREFFMSKGDVLLVYTDGIIEAEDENGGMYDGAGLVKTLTDHGGGSAAEIHDSVLAAIESYHRSDDTALVVIKKCS